MTRPKEEKIHFSEIASSQERWILVWFFGSLVLGFAFAPLWIVTLFLGLSAIPFLIPKVLMNFFAFLSQESGDNIFGKFFAFLGLICLGVLGLMIAAMIFGAITTPPLHP